jgi:hypothetical protein
MYGLRRILWILLLSLANEAAAGVNDNGVLLLHSDPLTVYTSGTSYCTMELDSCNTAITRVDDSATHVIGIFAGFLDNHEVELAPKQARSMRPEPRA